MTDWTRWRAFPNPHAPDYLVAPFAEGVYELRNSVSRRLVYLGTAKNVAYRMTSLVPEMPGGQGTRNNRELRDYVYRNREHIEYRTWACEGGVDIFEFEKAHRKKGDYLFPR